MKVKLIKFAGIIILTALTLLWSKYEGLQNALRPVLRALMLPMHLFASIVGALIVFITWPIKRLIRALKPAKP